MTKKFDNNSRSPSNETLITSARKLRWLYGILIPSFTTIFLLFILWFATNNFAIIFVSTIVLSLACLLVALICFRKAAVIASSIKKISNLDTHQYILTIEEKYRQLHNSEFSQFRDLEKNKGSRRWYSSWLWAGFFLSFPTFIEFNNYLNLDKVIIFENFIATIYKISFFYFGTLYFIYWIAGKWQGLSIFDMRYQSDLPRWAIYADKSIMLVGGHALGLLVIYTFKLFTAKG